ncbi:MAG: DUF6769 family protein [Lentimicrobium sp.]|jgi:hypothetical protein
MIKKLTAFSFILLANIILLAHAVFPHHHHEQLVCIERTHCVDDATPHTQKSPEHNHQHDGADNTTCVINQAVIISSSQARFVNNCDNCSDNHNHDFYNLSNFGYIDLLPVSEVITYIPEFSSFLISYVTTSLGLRAPPVV